MSASAESPAGPQRASPRRYIGRYELIRTLGEGGLATVYLGRRRVHDHYEQQVAIKVLHPHLRGEPEVVEQLIREAKIAERIHHPSVARVLDVDEHGGDVFLVMEYVEGATLGAMMKHAAQLGTTLGLAVVARVLVDVLEALHTAHELCDQRGAPLDVVHRDVSPQNIIVGIDGIARLIDFGIAKVKHGGQATRTGLVKGKAAYMAPEQAQARAVDRRCDIWAVGVIAWESLAGRRLFKTDNELSTMLEVVTGEAPALHTLRPDLPPAISAVVHRALDKDPDRRFPTARAFAEELSVAIEIDPASRSLLADHARACMDELGESSGPPSPVDGTTQAMVSPPEPPSMGAKNGERAGPRRAWMYIGAGGAAVAALISVVWSGGWAADANRGAPPQANTSTAPDPSHPSPARTVRLIADAEVQTLRVSGRAIDLPAPTRQIDVAIERGETSLVIEAHAVDGRTLHLVSTTGSERVDLVFPDPAAPKLTATALVVPKSALPPTIKGTPKPQMGASPHAKPTIAKEELPLSPSPYGGSP